VRLGKKLAAILYPPRCPYCGGVIRLGEASCVHCAQDLPRRHGPLRLAQALCGHTLWCAAPFHYTGTVRKAVLAMKFNGHREYAAAFGAVLCSEVSSVFPKTRFDFITWVPVTSRRLQERGYNQAQLLAEETGERLGAPVRQALVKPRDTEDQHALARAERLKNVVGAYRLLTLENVRGKSILLCDDIATTGATLRECARTIYGGGAALVCCAVVAAVD
jgi:competence protein ComFC